MSGHPTIFISYRRTPSADFARYLREHLTRLGGDAFLDVEDINGERFLAKIEREIILRDVFLVILSPDTLESKWVQREIETALRHQKKIVPVVIDGFSLATAALPPEIAALAEYDEIRYDREYAHAALERIVRAVGIHERRGCSGMVFRHRRVILGTLVTILTLLFAFLALFPESTRSQWFCNLGMSCPATPTISPSVTPTHLPTSSPSSTPASTSMCTISEFSVSPTASSYPVDTPLSLIGRGSCIGGVRASRFTIDGSAFGEDASATEQSETWRVTEGQHTICFEITNGDWEVSPQGFCHSFTGFTPTSPDEQGSTNLLNVYRDTKLLVVYAPEQEAAQISLVDFSFHMNGDSLELRNYPAFRTLNFTAIHVPACFVLYTREKPDIPPLCGAVPSNQLFFQVLVAGDLFWTDGENLRDFEIVTGTGQTTTCPADEALCSVPLVLP